MSKFTSDYSPEDEYDIRTSTESIKTSSSRSRKMLGNLKFSTISSIVQPEIQPRSKRVMKKSSLDVESTLNFGNSALQTPKKFEIESIQRQKIKLMLNKNWHIQQQRQDRDIESQPTLRSVKSTATLKDLRRAQKIKTRKALLSTVAAIQNFQSILKP